MGHHIDSEGRFQSDRHPDLAPDKIVVSFKRRQSWPALRALALSSQKNDPELAEDILTRLRSLGSVCEADDG